MPVPLLALSAFTALGVLGGYAAASSSAPRMGNELQRYFETYLALGTRSSFGAETLLGTIVCYFRAPFFAFLSGFASVGVLLIPLIYLMPTLVSDKTMGVYLAEPVADALAVTFTAILFFFQFRKAMRKLEAERQA